MTEDAKSGKHHEGDVAFIQSLAELLNSSELSELSVKREYGENDRLTVSLSKYGKQVMMQAPAALAPPPVAAPQSPATPTATPGATVGAETDPGDLPGAITSPMVGTAYLSAEPGAAPFVSIGQKVSEGDTLLIVEAMKTMNHIPSPKSGTVKRILVDDGTPVEYGAPLMVVE
ncbi:acetyl-CoA carboxylase biotin carboxyl carrier protein [Paracoccus aerodenitrificans]|uniref:acetyl-CoA carboxylase biotin carboxyl carrier protein n=1 Tax=Paracoccus aerodenitrificans TaxID=3017781 RepID=UPI0022F09971|nr:acetyl-CoA carboxylase biotin carboxyl carrier protein [Paracoccus aerodenitrificans]WBU64247.1 acetyl-CoA carboxylase biotin carboxyl carrier protein [Paracoccus aerodenitrificans]